MTTKTNNTNIYFLVLIASLSLLNFSSCKKADTLIDNGELVTPVKDRTPGNFFNLPTNASPVLQKVAKELERQNKSNEFIKAFVAKQGFPIWNKSRIEKHKKKTTAQSLDGNGGGTDTIVYIPLVVSAQQYVHGFLKAVVNDSVDIHIFRQNDYKDFPFQGGIISSPNVTTAENFAVRMMGMDRDVFGNKEFKIADKRMFHGSSNYSDTAQIQRFIKLDSTTGETNFSNGSTINGFMYNICITVETYINTCNLAGSNNNVAGTPSCWQKTETVLCNTWDDESNSGGGSWPIYPPGHEEGPGGGGGTGGPTTPPCSNEIINGFMPIECDPGPGGNPWPAKDANGFLYLRLHELETKIAQNPFVLDPCDSLNLINLAAYGPMYQRIAQFTASAQVLNRLDSLRQAQGGWIVDNYNIQSLEEAFGPIVNCDYFPLRITQFPNNISTSLPMTPAEFLEYFRLNINSFITSPITVNFSCNLTPQFDDCQKWNQVSGNAIGSLNHIYIPGNSGSVILSDYQHINTTTEQHYFKFSTLETPFDAEHPVAGNREFGVFNTSDSLSRYSFYTMAVDRTWDWQTNILNNVFGGFKRADSLWTNIFANVKDFINQNGGTASYYGKKNYIARPKWEEVKDYLRGNIDFDTLRQRLGC